LRQIGVDQTASPPHPKQETPIREQTGEAAAAGNPAMGNGVAINLPVYSALSGQIHDLVALFAAIFCSAGGLFDHTDQQGSLFDKRFVFRTNRPMHVKTFKR
jgi:hypothetical protein